MATNNLRFVTKNGLDNNSNSITNLGVSGASLSRAGAHDLILTTTGNTNVTFPTTGTLLTSTTLPTIPLGTGTSGNYVASLAAATPGTQTGTSGLTISATAGAGTAATIAHADTSTAANLSASARRYVTGLTFDTFGHVTAYTTGTETVLDSNWYPTSFAWANGTTAGPTGTLSGAGMSNVTIGAIPVASSTVSGVVNTTGQAFAGSKGFLSPIIVNNDFNIDGTGPGAQRDGLYLANLGTTVGTTLNPAFAAAIMGQIDSSRSVGFSMNSSGYLHGFYSHSSAGTYTWHSKVLKAATLETPRAINGVDFDGSSAITVTAAAGTLTGNTLASGITSSSLTNFIAPMNIGAAQTSNANIEIGNTGGTATTPFIDFHSGATPVDFDSRIIASGGTGTIGGGTLSYQAASHVFNNNVTIPLVPTADAHAASKQYVDNIATGLDFKQSVRVGTTANITLSGTQTIDGVAVVAGNRVLVKNQNTASQNGIYVVAAGAWTRSVDADNSPVGEVTPGMYCFIEEGTTNANTGWVLTTNGTITIGTTSLTFAQFTGLGQITAGNGLSKSGSTLTAVGVSGRIAVTSSGIDLATSGVTADTYRSVTVDTYGRVTSGTNPTTLAGYGITTGLFANGSASAPSIAFVNDPDTGIYTTGDNTGVIAFTTNGTQAMTLDGSGNTNVIGRLGVLSASPASTVAINSAATYGANSNYYGINNIVTIDNTTPLTASRTSYAGFNLIDVQLQNDTLFSISAEGSRSMARTSTSAGNSNDGYGVLIGANNQAVHQTNDATFTRVESMLGAYNQSYVTGSTAIGDNAYGTFSLVQASNAGSTINNAYGVRSRVLSNNAASSIGVGYLFYGDMSATGDIAHRYGVYIASNISNFFAGGLQVGGTASGNTSSSGVGVGVAPANIAGTIRTSNQILAYNTDTKDNPAYSWFDDLNTGMFRPGADTIAFSTAGTERVRINSAGQLFIGTQAGQTYGGTGPRLQLAGTDSSTGSIGVSRHNSGDSGGGAIYIGKSRTSAVDGVGALLSGDTLGNLVFSGGNGTALANGAIIRARSSQAWTGTNNGTMLEFMTSDNNTANPIVEMTIAHNGQITMPGNISSTSTTTGTLVVTGGVGISGRLAMNEVLVNGTSPNGSVRLHTGTADRSGYIAFHSHTSDTRQGFIGYSGTNSAGDSGTIEYHAGNHDFRGAVSASQGIRMAGGANLSFYETNVDWGVDPVNTWRRVATVVIGTGTHATHGYIVEIDDPQANHAVINTVNTIRHFTYYVACVRSESTTQDAPDACYVTGPLAGAAAHVRAVKTAVGSYEIQVQNLGTNREVRVSLRPYATNGNVTVTFHAGDAGAAGIAQYLSTVSTAASQWFQNVTVANSLTSPSSSIDVFNTDVTSVNAFQAATSLILGASSGFTHLRNEEIRIGNNAATPNYLSFFGTTGDTSPYQHTYIGERIYGGSEQSELLLFKGNDPLASSGPDRVRVFAGAFQVDTYTTATSGTFATVGASANATTRLAVASNGQITMPANIPSTSTVAGTLVVTGGVGISENLRVGGGIHGNGANITSLNASELTDGTVPNARLSGTYSGITMKIDGTNSIYSLPTLDNTSARSVSHLVDYRSSSSAATGAIVFTAGVDGQVMHQMEVTGLLYNPAHIVNLRVQAYWSNTAFSFAQATNLGTISVQVRFARNAAGRTCLILGDVGTVWSYPHITIARALFSHSGATDAYSVGWTASLVTNLSTYTNIVTPAVANSLPTVSSQTNWDTAFADRNKWDGGSDGLSAGTGRTSLGGTTVGQNFFTLTNPSSITFPRINANNSVSALTAADFRTAIGAGTSSTTGTVTSVGGTGTVSGIQLSGTVTSSGNLTLSGTLAVTPANFASQTARTFLAAGATAGVPTFRTIEAADVPTLNQNTTGTAATANSLIATNGTTAMTTTGVTSAVNHLTTTNATTGNAVTLSTAGSDTNIGLNITTKGTGAIIIDTGTGAGQIDLKPGSSNVRFWDDDSSHYYQLVTGNRTANYNINLPAGNVTLTAGTTVVTDATNQTIAGTKTFSGLTHFVVDGSQITLKSNTNSPTVIHRNDGFDYYILLSENSTAPATTWNTLRPLAIKNATGKLTSSNGQDFGGGTTFLNDVIANQGVRHGASAFPVYETQIDFGADAAGTWRKIVGATLSTNNYSTHGFVVDVIDPGSNIANPNSVNAVVERYYVAMVRTEGTVLNTPDACYVSGPSNRIRAIKTAQGVYEIQIQNAAQYREYRVRVSTFVTHSTHTIEYFTGVTGGTATATYNASVGTAQDRFQRVDVTATTASNSTATGALTVAGGVGVGGTLTAANIVSNTIQSTGRSAAYGSTDGVNTGAFNAVMGTGGNATWLLSGTSNGTFRYGIQGLDSGGTLRFYSGTDFMSFAGGTLTATTFSGSLSGNATTATTASSVQHTLTRGSYLTGENFNGSAARTWAVDATEAATALKVVARDSAADINVRLVRQNYANQSTISGGIVFRVNNTTDNYLRVCNDMGAVRTFIGANNADNLTSGTIPDGRISGSYTGITTLTVGTSPNGRVQLHQGNTTNSGYIAFHSHTSGTRQGYIGYATTNSSNDAGTIPYIAGTHAFSGNMTVNGDIAASTFSRGLPASSGAILTSTLTAGGTLYTNGTYTNQVRPGNTSGVASTWDFTVAGGIVTVATLKSGGSGFVAGETITIPALGGTGSGGLITVNTVRTVDMSLYNTSARIRLGSSNTALSAGNEIGGIYFNTRDASAMGGGDKASIVALAEGLSGGGSLNFYTSVDGGEATLAAAMTSAGNLRLYNTAGTFYTEISNSPTANRTITVPDVAGQFLVAHGTANTNGYFDTGSTTPTGTTRMNYSGYFYPTFINLSASGDTTDAASHYFVERSSDGFVRPKTLANVRTEIVTNAAVNSAAATTVGTITSGTWSATTIAVNRGGTGQTSYTNGELLIGNTTGNTLTKATLTAGTNVSISNGNGSITINATNTTYSAGNGIGLSSTTFSVAAGTGLTQQSTGLALTEITAGDVTVGALRYGGSLTATAGQFDGSTTAPTGTLRLNYNGYLYATRFYGDGSNISALSATNVNAGILGSSFGGTGINNGGRTLTLTGQNFTLSGTLGARTITTASNITVSGATTNGRTLTFATGDADRTVTLANNFTTAGNFGLTLTTTAATNVTLPTSGTLATTAQLPTVNDGVLTVAVAGTGLAVSATPTFSANQSAAKTITLTLSSTTANNANSVVLRDGSGRLAQTTTIFDGVGAVSVGYRSIPRVASSTLNTSSVGKCHAVTAGVTVPSSTFAAGDAITIYNDSATAVTLTQGSGLTLRLSGTTTTGNRTLAPRGIATLWFNSATEAIASGSGLT